MYPFTHSVKELLSRLSITSSSASKDYNEFKDWLKIAGSVSEAEQLKWVLESQKVSDSTKQALIESIAKESSEIEEEKKVLLKNGRPSKEQAKKVEETAELLVKEISNARKSYIGLAIAFMSFYLLVNVLCPEKAHSGLGEVFAMIFFCLSIMFLPKIWEAGTKIKEAREEAAKIENRLVGAGVQEQIAKAEEREEKLYELNKMIVRCSTNKSDAEEKD